MEHLGIKQGDTMQKMILEIRALRLTDNANIAKYMVNGMTKGDDSRGPTMHHVLAVPVNLLKNNQLLLDAIYDEIKGIHNLPVSIMSINKDILNLKNLQS